MIEIIRPYIEFIYFFTGGPLLALFAFLALKQITVAKQTATLASRREAYRLSAEQTHVYATEIVPRIDRLNQAIKDKKIKFFEKSKVTVVAEGIRVNREDVAEEWEQLIEIIPEFLDVVNRLETFSLYFISLVASESIAYSSVGRSYVRSVQKLLPLIAIGAEDHDHRNIMKLFFLWHERLEEEQLLATKSAIEEKLQKKQTNILVPIGDSK